MALVWLLVAYVVWGLHIEPHATAPGYDSGSRSACGESCWLRLWYELPFSLGL